MHVTVDGARRHEGVPWTEALVHQFCDRAILHAGMLCIKGPDTRQFQGHIYGIAILAESHVAAHLDVMRALAYLEMFSCREFDADGFVDLCRESFGLARTRTRMFDRKLPAARPNELADAALGNPV